MFSEDDPETYYKAMMNRYKEELSTLTAKVKRYQEALEFYADPDTYGADDVSRTTGNKQFDIVCFDSDRDFKKGIDMSGKRARAALNEDKK